MNFYIASHWPLAGQPANQQARQRTRPQHQRNTSATPTQQHRNSRRTSKNNALLHNVAPLGGDRSEPAMYCCMNNVQPRAGGPVKQQRVPPPGRSPTGILCRAVPHPGPLYSCPRSNRLYGSPPFAHTNYLLAGNAWRLKGRGQHMLENQHKMNY